MTKETKLKTLIKLKIQEGQFQSMKHIAHEIGIDPPRFSRILDNPTRKLSAMKIRELAKILELTDSEMMNVLLFDEVTATNIRHEDIQDREEAADQAIFELNEIKKRLLQLELVTIEDENRKRAKKAREIKPDGR